MTNKITINIVTHAECLDGIAAAWVVQDFYQQSTGYDVFIHYQYYHKPLPEFPEGAHVIMVDFCPNDVEELKALFRRVQTLVVIDHHPKTEAVIETMKAWVMAEHRMADFDYMYSRHKSGALLAWDYYREGDAPKLIKYVSDHDLWQFRLSRSKDVCAALEIMGMTIEAFQDCLNRDIYLLEAAGKALRQAKQQHVEWTIQQTRCVLVGNQLVDGEVQQVYLLAVNGNNFIKNEVCARMEQCYPGFAGYVCYWDLAGGHERRYSVRSKEKNAQAIAKYYCGEGHQGAAGFVLARDSDLEVVLKSEDAPGCPRC